MNAKIKKHIDSARQVLVGVVPNPTSQIDQITNALIYKFMDDMDQAAIKNGGKPNFFVGELEKYTWTKLMDSRVGNQERMNIYTEALIKFSESKQLPELFRSIFKSAFLPYRSPEVLGLFLKEINYFDYSHPEELGNAYEFLLSIMSSQGDAGQFRTPRHIIDFMVDIVNPTKNDKVLDPACGTGGFLIKAYKHILEQHDGLDDPDKKEKSLTPDERKSLFNNFEGYDIDPGMVRIAQVNMYLHQFKNPKIYQYDTLSMEERWNDKFDVILANPPFMSPKGGIKPHNKFGVQSSRSEVLFVDYIMNHLRPNGRAAVIVPEGIIFQSGTSYKQLRKNLIDDGLYCVVSLPSGVFQPYSGVKTSILFFDNNLTKQKNEILFVDIKDTGISLGATQNLIDKNDLIPAIEIIKSFQTNKNIDLCKLAFETKRQEIISSGYDLSLAKYIKRNTVDSEITFVCLSDICTITKGKSSSTKTAPGSFPLFLTAEVPKTSDHFDFDSEGVCVPLISATGHGKAAIKRVHYVNGKFSLANLLAFVKPIDNSQINSKYLFYILDSEKDEIAKLMKGAANVSMKTSDLGNFQIPVPHIEIQYQIVVELENYNKIVDGAKQIVENWKPKIDINPEWKKVRLEEVGKVCMCKRIFKEQTKSSGETPFYKIGTFGKTPDAYIDQELFKEYKSKYSYPKKGAILLSTSGTIGKIVVFDGEPAYFQDSNIVWIDNDEKLVINEYLYYVFQMTNWVTTKGGTIERLYNKLIEETIIYIPPISIQKQIVEKIKAERTLVESAKKLIEIYEEKIRTKIAEVIN